MAGELEQIAKEIAACTKCPLHKGRCKTVPGEGSTKAKLLFIGEAPGYHEDQQGRPFVGPSGDLLNKLIKAVKLQREDVFIANVVKCRPPNNRDPLPEEMAACKPYLDRQIAAINPRVIVTLGRFSMARYFPGERISQIHGQPKEEGGRIILPMFHPAAALRDTVRTLPMFKEDAMTIPALLERAEEIAATELWGRLMDSDTPEIELSDSPRPPREGLGVRAESASPSTDHVAETPAVYETEPASTETANSPEATDVPVEVEPVVKTGRKSRATKNGATKPEPIETQIESIPTLLGVEPVAEKETVKTNGASRKKKKEVAVEGEQLTLF